MKTGLNAIMGPTGSGKTTLVCVIDQDNNYYYDNFIVV